MPTPFLKLVTAISTLTLAAATAGAQAKELATTQPPVEDISERIIRDFELVDSGYAASHRGIDIQVNIGEIIRSPVSGYVHFSGYVVNRPVISVMHASGDLYAFEPACSAFESGERVVAGEPIAEVCESDDSYSHCPKTCLHISLRVSGHYLSPLARFGFFKPSRLYPLSRLEELNQARG